MNVEWKRVDVRQCASLLEGFRRRPHATSLVNAVRNKRLQMNSHWTLKIDQV